MINILILSTLSQVKPEQKVATNVALQAAEEVHRRFKQIVVRACPSIAKAEVLRMTSFYRKDEDSWSIKRSYGNYEESIEVNSRGIPLHIYVYIEPDLTASHLSEAKLEAFALQYFSAFEPSLEGMKGEFDVGMYQNTKDGFWYRNFAPRYKGTLVGPSGVGRITLEGATGMCKFVSAKKMFDVRKVRDSKLSEDEAVGQAMSKALRSGATMVEVSGKPKKYLTGNGHQGVFTLDPKNPTVQRVAKLDTGEYTYQVFLKHLDLKRSMSSSSNHVSGYLISATDGSVFGSLNGSAGAVSMPVTPALPEKLLNVTIDDGKRKSRKKLIRFTQSENPSTVAGPLREVFILSNIQAFKVQLSEKGDFATCNGKGYKVSYL